ncbi:MAG: glycosyltransferase family 4 protein [Chloroflexi bacterium]|nr:glycosyltransferase family 4 protein [Chloroflexota bacterium]
MRWLLITRKLDPDDARTGFMLRWVEGLAARMDHLDVICQENAGPDLPANVRAYSMGKESGAGRLEQSWRLTNHLRRIIPQVDGVFCHMMPRYVWFAAPWALRYHKPLWFWYVHRQITPELRLAHRLASRILTAAPSSYPISSEKTAVLGHGIEPGLFHPADGKNNEAAPLDVVLVARLSAIKKQDMLLRAASLALARGDVPPFRVVLAGGTVEHEPDYRAELESLAQQLDPAPAVTLTGPLPQIEIAEQLRRCAVAVNLSPVGLFDKAALEPMFAGRPVIVGNPDFLPLLGDAAPLLSLPEGAGAAELADRLARLLRLSPEERANIGAALRERALAAHSLDGLMDRITGLMRDA